VRFSDTLVLDGEIEASTILQLSDISPLQFLPGSLMDEFWCSPLPTAPGDFFCGNKHVGSTAADVEANAVACL
jgi:hypothetical protein